MPKTKEKYGTSCFVKCRIEPGLFKEEWLVALDALNPNQGSPKVEVQLFVDHRNVKGYSEIPKRGHPVSALLEVSFVRNIGSVVQVILPQPAQPLGENVFVEKSDVVEVD